MKQKEKAVERDSPPLLTSLPHAAQIPRLLGDVPGDPHWKAIDPPPPLLQYLDKRRTSLIKVCVRKWLANINTAH